MTEKNQKIQEAMTTFIDRFADPRLSKAMSSTQANIASEAQQQNENNASNKLLSRLRSTPFALSRTVTDI